MLAIMLKMLLTDRSKGPSADSVTTLNRFARLLLSWLVTQLLPSCTRNVQYQVHAQAQAHQVHCILIVLKSRCLSKFANVKIEHIDTHTFFSGLSGISLDPPAFLDSLPFWTVGLSWTLWHFSGSSGFPGLSSLTGFIGHPFPLPPSPSPSLFFFFFTVLLRLSLVQRSCGVSTTVAIGVPTFIRPGKSVNLLSYCKRISNRTQSDTNMTSKVEKNDGSCAKGVWFGNPSEGSCRRGELLHSA